MASSLLFLLFQSSDTPQVPTALGAGLLIGFMLVSLVLMLVIVASFWKMFVKAGQPGWAALIPIYNAFVLLKIAGKSPWWILLLCVPVVNLVVFVALAQRFGKSTGFGIGLGLLTPIFVPILGFGDSQYR